MKFTIQVACLTFIFICLTPTARGDDFDQLLKPLLTEKCSKCHGNEEANGDVNFQSITSSQQLIAQPDLIQRMLKAIDTGSMPPEEEAALDVDIRDLTTAALKSIIRDSTNGAQPEQSQFQRLNRFQYNNTVRDLFKLNRDVFALPEKLMTRQDNYLHRRTEHSAFGKMPKTVHVASHALSPLPGMQGVNSFPKDLRAEHGFDNQASQLNMSPLLLDSFLKLSVSIVESPDFNEQTVGIWHDFFQEPVQGIERNAEVRLRLANFLRLAFRGPVDDETLNRYVNYTSTKMDQGLSFTEAMKKAASAILSSPMFLFRTPATNDRERQFELASKLSYFLWSSCPDEELLMLAGNGTLSDEAVLDRTVTRMLSDPRIERFLDAFPTQWMQLENLLAVTPDPSVSKYFRLDAETPASLQMVLEPLLLFDAVFVENRPVMDLIAPEFSYRSDFLQTWYTSDLRPPSVNAERIIAQNQLNDQNRHTLQAELDAAKTQLEELIEPIRQQILNARQVETKELHPVDLQPYAVWEFNGDLSESIHSLQLTAHGEIEFRDGMVILDKAYLTSNPLPIDLRAKTLEVWCQLDNLDQRGGGLMGVQGTGDFFDTIVIGERKNRHWISGSNGFSRTKDFPDSVEETITKDILHLVMVYAEDGTTTLYRNGQPYGMPFQSDRATFPRDSASIIFGLRHLPPGGNKFLTVSIDQARLYDRSLSADEVAASARGHISFISDTEWMAALTPDQREQKQQLMLTIEQAETELKNVPENIEVEQAQQFADQNFENDLKQQLRSREFKRMSTTDPRFGGVITNAAVLSMTSGPKRTHPVARGVWVIEVIFNDPPLPPPNDVPPLDEESGAQDMTIREQFAVHRENPSCAGCHAKLDPLGFALENFDITGRWRDTYANGREVDSSGTLLRKYEFGSVIQFKNSLVKENRRFAKAFTEHLLRYSLARELHLSDTQAVESILEETEPDQFPLQGLIRGVVRSESFTR
jgi:hypothetical protein